MDDDDKLLPLSALSDKELRRVYENAVKNYNKQTVFVYFNPINPINEMKKIQRTLGGGMVSDRYF